MRRGASRRAVLALLLAVPVATGSCAPSTLRTGLLEERLARELRRRLDRPGIVVECPVRIEVRRGDVFECVALSTSGDRLRIRVTQVDDEGGVTWETAGLDG
ncbi:MAG TPA: DUF4333 domain-containing protein [Actinomycetota bacterium]